VNILRKEDNNMNYTKPEVAVLGNASTVIEVISTKSGAPHDNNNQLLTGPAYDLDE
jgi:hypothetical protein